MRTQRTLRNGHCAAWRALRKPLDDTRTYSLHTAYEGCLKVPGDTQPDVVDASITRMKKAWQMAGLFYEMLRAPDAMLKPRMPLFKKWMVRKKGYVWIDSVFDSLERDSAIFDLLRAYLSEFWNAVDKGYSEHGITQLLAHMALEPEEPVSP